MNTFNLFFIHPVNSFSDPAGTVFACSPDAAVLLAAVSGVTVILALSVMAWGNIPDAVLALVRKWHGTIGEQFSCIDNVCKIIQQPHPAFSMPLTTEDLAAALDRQHHEEFEVRMQEVERQRREIERLQAELNAKNASL
jgi:hypothetical protein